MGRMDAGKRDRRITIQQASFTTNAFNEEIATWADLATVWAEKMDVSDRERLQATEVQAQITTRFRVLWSSTVSGVNPKDHRIEYPAGSGTIFEIFSVKEIGRRQGIEITGTARADG